MDVIRVLNFERCSCCFLCLFLISDSYLRLDVLWGLFSVQHLDSGQRPCAFDGIDMHWLESAHDSPQTGYTLILYTSYIILPWYYQLLHMDILCTHYNIHPWILDVSPPYFNRDLYLIEFLTHDVWSSPVNRLGHGPSCSWRSEALLLRKPRDFTFGTWKLKAAVVRTKCFRIFCVFLIWMMLLRRGSWYLVFKHSLFFQLLILRPLRLRVVESLSRSASLEAVSVWINECWGGVKKLQYDWCNVDYR